MKENSLRSGIDFEETGCFGAQGRTLVASWSASPAQKLLVRSWTGPENFSKILWLRQ
jgi:hypothetical protein